jgi:hypothetical protein
VSEGEFKKRTQVNGFVVEQSEGRYRVVSEDVINEVIDEARKDFPWHVLCNVGHPMFPADEKSLGEWVKRWFGDVIEKK